MAFSKCNSDQPLPLSARHESQSPFCPPGTKARVLSVPTVPQSCHQAHHPASPCLEHPPRVACFHGAVPNVTSQCPMQGEASVPDACITSPIPGILICWSLGIPWAPCPLLSDTAATSRPMWLVRIQKPSVQNTYRTSKSLKKQKALNNLKNPLQSEKTIFWIH